MARRTHPKNRKERAEVRRGRGFPARSTWKGRGPLDPEKIRALPPIGQGDFEEDQSNSPSSNLKFYSPLSESDWGGFFRTFGFPAQDLKTVLPLEILEGCSLARPDSTSPLALSASSIIKGVSGLERVPPKPKAKACLLGASPLKNGRVPLESLASP